VPNGEHFIPFSRLEYMRRGIRFFDRHLKSVPSVDPQIERKTPSEPKRAAIASGNG